jgi:pyroglutamyl-peptidase
MYGVLHFLAASGRKARAGFVHLPYAEEQVLASDAPAMSIESMVKGIEAGITAAASNARDVRSPKAGRPDGGCVRKSRATPAR